MSIIELLVGGFLSSFAAGDSCIAALHQLRAEERLQVVATDVLEDNVLAFTLSDSPRIGAKTAILICQRNIDETAAEDPGIVDDPQTEVLAPIEETDDAVAPTEEDAAIGAETDATEDEILVE